MQKKDYVSLKFDLKISNFLLQFFKQKLIRTFAPMFFGTHTFFFRRLKILILLFSIFGSTLTFSQSGNPFEIKSRLKEAPIENSEREEIEQPVENSNPFELIRSEKAAKPAAGVSKMLKPELESERTPIPLEQKKSFLFVIIVSMLVLTAVIITLMREFMFKAARAFMNDNMLTQLHREQGFLPQIPYLLLYFLFFINAGIFTWLVLDYYEALPFGGTWLNLYATTGIILAIFLFKHILLRFIGSLFPISKELSIYSFTIMIFNIIIGLALVIFNFGLAYLSDGLFLPLFWVAVALIIAAFLFRQLRGIFIGGKYVAMHKFHFLLYLCAVEVAPVMVYLKLILLAQEA